MSLPKPNNAKALVGAVLSALGTTAAAAVPGSTGVGTTSTVASAIMGLVSYLGVYWTENGKSPREAAQGLVVNIKTDVGAFAAAFAAGLPALVASSAEAAIQPKAAPVVDAPANPAPTAPEAATVEPAILGKA